MTMVMQAGLLQAGETCSWLTVDGQALAVLLQALTLAYLAYGFWRTTKNQTRIEEYLKRLEEKDKK
jgi:hypothetical protein